jgi:Tfp pilus assembly protein PilO
MKYLSKRFISILLSFTFIAIALVLYVNFIKPAYADIKKDQGKLNAITSKNQEYKDVFGKLKGVLDELKKSPDLQNRVSMVLPLSANTPDSLNQITSIASANGLTISSAELIEAPAIPTPIDASGSASIVKGIGVIRNNIRISGTYAQIKSFLQGVESGVRISSIKSMRIDRSSTITNTDSYAVALEVETYYQANQ